MDKVIKITEKELKEYIPILEDLRAAGINANELKRYVPVLCGLNQFEKEHPFGEYNIKIKHHIAEFVDRRPSYFLKLAPAAQE